MAINLTNTWKQHAFPDNGPGREERWSLDSERRRIHDRTDFDLEQSGSTNKIRRFTSGRNDELNGKTAKEKADDDIMMLAVGSPAYMEAYNTRLTFQIDGKDVEITQGKLYDLAKKRAEDLRKQIDDAKQRGASDDEIARMQTDLNAYKVIRDNANPVLGPMTPERHAAVTSAVNRTPDVKNRLTSESEFGRDADNAKTQEGDTSLGIHNDGEAQDAALHDTIGASVADGLTNNPFAQSTPALKAAFTAVAPDAPVSGGDKPAPVVPPQHSGFGLG